MSPGAPAAPTTIEGPIEAITFKSEERDFAILRLKVEESKYPDIPRDKYGRIAIVGNLRTLNIGDHVKVTGELHKHQAHGWQIKVSDFIITEPSTLAGIVAYLENTIDLIGPKYARKIVAHFGENTLRILDESPDRVREVKGVGKARLDAIIENWGKTRQLRKMMMFISGIGLGPKVATDIQTTWPEDAVQRIQQDPYCLARHIDGVGFLRADEVAKKLGIPEMSPYRIRAAIEHVINERTMQVGDCFQYKSELVSATFELLKSSNITQQMIEETLLEGASNKLFVIDDNRVYVAKMYAREVLTATTLATFLGNPPPQSIISRLAEAMEAAKASSAVPLTDVQLAAIQKSLSSRVSVITGGPGTGKTTITRGLVAAYEHLGETITLLAPTGRAAKRMQEVIGKPAYTMHKVLNAAMREHYTLQGVVLVDEMSMTDIGMLGMLLACVNRDESILVFVGDKDQLPSVGPGAVLRDLLNCHYVPSTSLTTIFRQAASSDIIVNAHRINSGQMPKLNLLSSRWDVPTTDMWTVTKDRHGADSQEAFANIAVYCATHIASCLGYNPVTDVHVLAPMHKGEAGVAALNRRLQMTLNPSPADRMIRGEKTLWGLGDKLMQMKNNRETGLVNGDIGVLKKINRDEDQHVTSITISVDGQECEVPAKFFNELEIAYASTVHKMQGSQSPMIVMVLHTGHYAMLQRNLLFTGVTRAMKHMILVCSEEAVQLAVRNNKIANRNTYLAERIERAFESLEETDVAT